MDLAVVWRKRNTTRVAAITVVLALHGAIALLISLPAQPLTHRLRSTSTRTSPQRMVVRLIVRPRPRTPETHSRPTIRLPPRPAHADKPRAATPSRRHVTDKAATRPPLDLSLPATQPDFRATPSRQGRVGRSLAPTPLWNGSHLRLPGYDHVHGAPRLHMIPPQQQGVAGALRTLQGLFGIAPKPCVDVDVWRTMTREERFKQHVTQAQIDATTERYDCYKYLRGRH